MKISNRNIMALQGDLCFIKGYLRELEAKQKTWRSLLIYIFIKSCAENADFKIENIQALIHVFSKTLEVARKVNKDEEDEDELFFSLLDLCESIRDEIAFPNSHNSKFIQVLENLNSRFDDDSWEQINEYVNRVRRTLECGKT